MLLPGFLEGPDRWSNAHNVTGMESPAYYILAASVRTAGLWGPSYGSGVTVVYMAQAKVMKGALP